MALLGLFSLAEAGLVAALGIGFGSLKRQHRIVGLGCAAIVRGILAIAAIVIWIVAGSHSRSLYEQSTYFYYSQTPVSYRWNLTVMEFQNLLGSTQLVFSPLADSGTLLITDLLRPVSLIDHLFQRMLTGVIALAAFAGLIWLSLRMAEVFAVRQHALRPRERELREHKLVT